MPKVSVLVPVYNVEDYLPQCLDSILAQTLQNIEVICVDDGSTDSSGKILDEYAAKDSRVKVYHQNNHGLAYTRNELLRHASAKWITFIDSDDYIKQDMLEKMLGKIVDTGADLCICDFMLPDKGYQSISDKKFKMKDEVITGYKALEYMNLPKTWPWVTACNKLYNIELFQGLSYPIGVQHEDQYMAHQIYCKVKTIVSISDDFYVLRYRADSITNSRYNIRQLDYMGALYDRIMLYQHMGFKQLYKGVELKALRLILQAYRKLGALKETEKERLKKAEDQYQHIYQIAYGKELDIIRTAICALLKRISKVN